MSNLGNLFFELGLGDKFTNDMAAAEKRLNEFFETAKRGATVNVTLSDDLKKLLNNGTGSSLASIKATLDAEELKKSLATTLSSLPKEHVIDIKANMSGLDANQLAQYIELIEKMAAAKHDADAAKNNTTTTTKTNDTEKEVSDKKDYVKLLNEQLALTEKHIEMLQKQNSFGVNNTKEMERAKNLQEAITNALKDESSAESFYKSLTQQTDKSLRKFDELYKNIIKLEEEINKLEKAEKNAGQSKNPDGAKLLTDMKSQLDALKAINPSNIVDFANTKGVTDNVNNLIAKSKEVRAGYQDIVRSTRDVEAQFAITTGKVAQLRQLFASGVKMDGLDVLIKQFDELTKKINDGSVSFSSARAEINNFNRLANNALHTLNASRGGNAVTDLDNYIKHIGRIEQEIAHLSTIQNTLSKQGANSNLLQGYSDAISKLKSTTTEMENAALNGEKYEAAKWNAAIKGARNYISEAQKVVSYENKVSKKIQTLQTSAEKMQKTLEFNKENGTNTALDSAERKIGEIRVAISQLSSSMKEATFNKAVSEIELMSKDFDILIRRGAKLQSEQAKADRQSAAEERRQRRKQESESKKADNFDMTKRIAQMNALARVSERIKDLQLQQKLSPTDKNIPEAIKQLEALHKKISETDMSIVKTREDIRKTFGIQVTASMKEAERALKGGTDHLSKFRSIMIKAHQEAKQLSEAFVSSNKLAGELYGTLANFVSLSTLKTFITDVITIGGEFEKQHIALQTILGDIAAADKLYGQLKEFAVVSPFEFKDVVQQTKQLAAFGIEEENLFDTTKRLGDIAAGVGVDFGRLALAFGEVKSRTFLDAKELRQFAYAGVPLLQKLSEYYGKSTQEIRKMMRAGKVSFEDTRKVLFKMTEEGGMFYNMQEAMADTVAGKWKNLGDAYDVMLSEIETANAEFLRGGIDVLYKLMGSWESWLPILAGVASGLLSVGVAMGAVGLAVKAVTLFTTPFTGWLAAINLIIGGIAAVVGGLKVAEQTNNAFANSLDKLETNAVSRSSALVIRMNNLVDKIKDAQEAMKSSNKESEAYKNAQKANKDAIALLNKEYYEKGYISNLIKEGDAYSYIAEQALLAATNIKQKAAADLYDQEMSQYNAKFIESQNDAISALKDKISGNYVTKTGKKLKAVTDIVVSDLMERVNNNEIGSITEDMVRRVLYGAGLTIKAGNVNNEDLLEGVDNRKVKDITQMLNAQKDVVKEHNKTPEKVTQRVKDIMGVSFTPNQSNPNQNTIDPYGGTGDDKDKGDPALKKWQTLEKYLESYIETYKKYRDLIGETAAKERVTGMDEFADLTKVAEFSDPSKVKEIYSALMNRLSSLPGGLSKSESRQQAYDALKGKLANVDFDNEKSEMAAAKKDLEMQIKTAKSQWDLYNEWLSSLGDKELAARMSGVNISFNNVVEQMREGLAKALKNERVQLTVDEVLGMDMEKLEEAYGKDNVIIKSITALQEEYRKLNEDSSKALLDIVKNHQTYASKVKAINDKLAEDLSKIAADTKLSPEQKDEIGNGLRKKANEDLSKAAFENFKDTHDWEKVFDDLDRVSTDTINRLMFGMKKLASDTNLSWREVRELQNAMKKLREESIDRNPFASFADALGRRKGALSEVRRIEGYKNTLGSGSAIQTLVGGEMKEYSREELEKMLKDAKDALQAANDDLANSALKVADKLNSVAEAADLLGGLFENIFGKSQGLEDAISVMKGTASGATTGANIAKTLGIGGPWGAIAGAGLGMLNSVFALHDKAIQREIDASKQRQKEMENMSKNLEKLLERTMGGIYNGETNKNGKSYFENQFEALTKQRYEVWNQRNLEEGKKKSDDGAIADYTQQLADLDDQIQHFAEDMAKSLYNIDYKSWADGLTDALVNAWRNGENAVDAWKNKVTDVLAEVGTSVISQKLIQMQLEPLMEEFMENFKKDNGQITSNSWQILAKMWEIGDEAAALTESYLDAMETVAQQHGQSFKNNGSNKSGLTASIQGVSEETAGLISSYINSIRANTAMIEHYDQMIVEDLIPEMSVIARSQLQQLNAIVRNTEMNAAYAGEIRDMFNSVIAGTKKIAVK